MNLQANEGWELKGLIRVGGGKWSYRQTPKHRVILKQVVFPKVHLLLRLAQDFAEETTSQLAARSY